ncbi:Gfo/Idh/MocA family oxidoreductase [Streptomyces sp. RerS4]|uniref:Gfo/Idh/MocA family protein n=1 Tax=Streptomyces sp. RerS4 TaxID=2942449 RepID=UPI00201C3B8C|nr:Gfo/Idh/MocA family oxidoreductase [Streptomyces sp. RerS4]UQX05451.1 Gfo/Idh/MocA family oxidoreductase [Streptomyces sp. RerS4]
MGRVRIGVLGCADIARRRMLPAMAAARGVEITAIASRDADRARQVADPYGAAPVHGYERLLARDDVDAVYVPLPAALHERWTAAALDAGKHVLAEKPLTTSHEATARLVTLAAAGGRVLMENVMFPHHPQHEAVAALVADGAIGEVRSFRAAFAIPALPAHDIRLDADLGGGALWDTGVYPVRAALHHLGPGLRVVGASLTRGHGQEVDTAGAALLRTPEGITAQLSFGLDHAYRSAYEIWGSRGRVTVDRAFTTPADLAPQVTLHTSAGTERIALPAADQVALTVAAFARAVEEGARPDPLIVRQAELLHELRTHAGDFGQPEATPVRPPSADGQFQVNGIAPTGVGRRG